MGVTRHPLYADDGRLPDVPADRAAIRRVRASLAYQMAQRTDLVHLFYAVLFERHPLLRNLFPSDLADVQCRMRAALALCVARLHEPETIAAELARLGRMHIARGVKPEHYPLACDCLVEAMRRISGAHWGPELEHDWRETLRAICATMQQAPGVSP
jgi:hemoglobin-like flavoprotein